MSVLSSLLARDQAVPVKKIEEAIQRQVISGGDLTTVLLEVGAAPENLIASYHAAAVDLRPASKDELMDAPADALAALPAALADEHRVVPLAIEGGRIVLASAVVPDDAVLAQLAEATGCHVLLRISTEPRIAAALQKHYGIAPTARLRRLIQKLEAQGAGDIISVTALLDNKRDRPSRPPIAALPELTGTTSIRPSAVGSWARSSKAAPTGVEETALASGNTRTTPKSNRPRSNRPAAPAAKASSVVAVGMHRVVGTSSKLPETSALAAYSHGHVHAAESVEPQEPVAAPVPLASNRPEANVPVDAPAPVEPVAPIPETLDAESAIAALANANTRDEVMAVTFAHCRTHFDYCALFAAHDEIAEGLEAAGDGASRQDVRELSIEFDRPSFARDVRQLLGPKAGVLDATEADRELAHRLGRTAKQPSVLIPVAIRQRLVLLVYGDRSGKPLGLGDVSELLAFLPRVSEALQRLILKRKRRSGSGFAGFGGSSHPAPAKDWARPAEARAQAAETERTSEPEVATEAERTSGPELATEAASTPAQAPAEEHESRSGAEERPRAFDLLGVPRKAPQPPELGMPARHSEPARAEPMRGRDSSRPSWLPGKPVSDTSYRASGVEEEVVLTRRKGRRSVAPAAAAVRSSVAVAPVVALKSPQLPVEAAGIADAVTPMPMERPQVSMPPGAERPATSLPPVAERPQVSLPPAAAEPKPRSTPAPAPAAANAFDDDDEPEISVAEPPTPTSDAGATIITDLGLDLDELVDSLISADRESFDSRLAELLQFGEPALRVLVRRFPGPLWVDPRANGTVAPPRARDVGPVLRALVGFRPHATANVATLLDSRDPEIRYFAVLVAAEMPHRDLVGRIGRRVLDDDANVRAASVHALRAFRRFEEEVSEVLAHFRRVAGNDRAPATLREIAVELLGELRDGDAVTVLVDLLGEGHPEITRRAHQSLVRITKQDFGPSQAAWDSWLRDRGDAHRIEWLIDALLHDDETSRREAGEELKSLTQEYFGFQSALPRKEREVVQRKYRKWWDTHGRTRFVKH